MRHQNSVFHGLTKQLPWSQFERLVAKHKADHRVRRLDSKSQLLALLFGQLAGAESLREIETGLLSHGNRLYHLGVRPAARSTLADANASRPWTLFAELFAVMAQQASRTTRRKLSPEIVQGTHILDATKVKLSGLSADWARFSKNHCAAKLHVVYDPHAALPLRAEVTSDKVNDIIPAKAWEIASGATYVFDMAYYDFAWWAKLDAQGCRFVTRLKRHTKLIELERREGPQDQHSGHAEILSDRVGLLPRRLARSRKNPMAKPVREIVLLIATGKQLRVVTNDLKAPAREIAELYKQRWQVELFFKWIKQNLKIRHFLGTSENAVRIQLFVALIAFLLLRAAQAHQDNQASKSAALAQPRTFARLIRLNLMHRRHINTLDRPQTPHAEDPRQLAWSFTPTGTGQ